jgi:diguanylate cyclase (GGDEF)-like protein/PAS domain S-box-containing protein
MAFSFVRRSLRAKLILASVLVEALMLGFLVTNSLRVTQDSLVGLASLRLEEMQHLLNASLGAPLVQRDLATLQEIMDQSRREEGIVYMVLYDDSGRALAASGWEIDRPTPSLTQALSPAEAAAAGRIDSAVPLTVAGTVYGKLQFGVSTHFLTDAKARLLQESLGIAAAEILLSIAVLALLGMYLTRHLRELTDATAAIVSGRNDCTLPIKTTDEVGRLTAAFNAMTLAVRTRIEQLSLSERKFHAIADYTYDWENWHDPESRLIWVNPSVERMTGYSVDEYMSLEDVPFSLVHEADTHRSRRARDGLLHNSTGSEEFRIRRKDGSAFWAQMVWQPIYDDDGRCQGVRSSLRDVTAQKQSQADLQEKVAQLHQSEQEQARLLGTVQTEHARLRCLLASLRRGILFVAPDDTAVYHNPSFSSLWSLASDLPLAGHTTAAIAERIRGRIAQGAEQLFSHAFGDQPLDLLLADERVITQTAHPVSDDQQRPLGHIWVFEDVTEERHTSQQLVYLAERDSLTGLYNRRRFEDELTHSLCTTRRRDSHGAVLFFDLDEFKYINDTFGHRAGDTMLVRVAQEVGSMIRQGECFSRVGGDEFAVLMPEASQSDAQRLAQRIVRAVSQIAVKFDSRPLHLTTSIGISLYPHHGTDQEELIARADAAMYQAKAAGKNAWRVYREDLDTSKAMLDRLAWMRRIDTALEKGLLRLRYQGVYDTTTMRLCHVEALVRMVDVEQSDTLIAPAQFISVAEKTGKIVDIDRWVIRSSIRSLAEDPEFVDLPVSVNISGRCFDDPTLAAFIMDELLAHGVAPERLIVEITETAAISDIEDAQRFIAGLRQRGCCVCLDDFGAGFSSFSYLKRLSADILKIDGQFIVNLARDKDNQVLVKAIVDVARGLGKRTVAEFVEEAATLALLQEMGVDMVQGYYLSKPSVAPPRAAQGGHSR